MKRCPHCEFIYEDDQSLCDMDGILLVFDSQKLPRPAAVAKSHWRSRLIPAAAALVLTTVLFLVYYVSTRQTTNRATYAPTAVTDIQPTAANELPPSSTVIDNPAETGALETKPSPEVKVSSATSPKPASTTPKPTEAKKKSQDMSKSSSGQKPQTTSQPQRDDSKIGSIIKKTGRLLKKPFKF